MRRLIQYAVIAGVLAAAVWAGGYAVLRGGRQAPPRVRGTVLVVYEEPKVVRVQVTAGAGKDLARASFERAADGRWWQAFPPPREGATGKVASLLDALPRLTRRATLASASAGRDALREYGLDVPRARVELGLADGTSLDVDLGDDNGPQGVGFVLAPDGDVCTVPAEALEGALDAVARLLPAGALPARTPAPFGG